MTLFKRDHADEALLKLHKRQNEPAYLGSFSPVDGEFRSSEPVPVPTTPPKPQFPAPQGIAPDYTAAEVAELLALLAPLKLCCTDCGKWRDVPATLDRLREYRAEYVDSQQQRLEAEWRAMPEVVAAAQIEAATVAERQAEAREQAERGLRKQRLGDEMFQRMLRYGATVAEARDAVSKEYPGDW